VQVSPTITWGSYDVNRILISLTIKAGKNLKKKIVQYQFACPSIGAMSVVDTHIDEEGKFESNLNFKCATVKYNF